MILDLSFVDDVGDHNNVCFTRYLNILFHLLILLFISDIAARFWTKKLTTGVCISFKTWLNFRIECTTLTLPKLVIVINYYWKNFYFLKLFRLFVVILI